MGALGAGGAGSAEGGATGRGRSHKGWALTEPRPCLQRWETPVSLPPDADHPTSVLGRILTTACSYRFFGRRPISQDWSQSQGEDPEWELKRLLCPHNEAGPPEPAPSVRLWEVPADWQAEFGLESLAEKAKSVGVGPILQVEES